MNNTRAQQKALDDELVAPANRLKIGKSNLRLSSNLKSKEPTLQVVLDALKLTLFYKAFEITTDVPEIYMQEFWVTISKHYSSLCFKLNGKRHTVNIDNFRDMLKIFPKLLGMYHNKVVDYVYLLWEDLVYQVEKKNSKKNNDMYYPRFTKVIIDYFMAKDQAIPKRNKMFWHYARDDFMFTTIRVISKHQDTQVYGVILPQHLTNQAMLESKAYMTYRAYTTGEKTPKPKYTKKKADSESSPKIKPIQASKEKRIKTSDKGDKPAKKKQSATKSKGLTVLSKVDLTEAEQMKIALERSKIQTHSSHASGSGADEGTAGMHDDNDDNDDNDNNDDDDDDADNQDDEGQNDVNEQTDLDNDGDDFVHPKFSTHDEEDRQEEEDKEEDIFDPRVQTPSHVESTDDEDSDEEIKGANVEGDKPDEEDTNEEVEANELYRDVNVNLVGRDTEMTDAPRIDSLFNLNTKSTSLVDVPVTINAESPLLSTTTFPPPPTPLITHLLKTLETDFSKLKQINQFAAAVSLILGIVDAYLTNKMHEAVKIVVQLQSERLKDEAQAKNADFINKLDDNIKKIIKDQVKEQVKAQVSKILLKIKKTINEQHKAEVLTRLSNESKTSHVVAANLSELELKKILIDKMESNKSIHRSDEQKNLYKALIDAYESDKLILNTYGETVSFKRRRDEEDKYEEPSAGSNRGSKRRRAGKEPESTSTPKEKTSKTIGKSTKGSKSYHKSADESAQAEDPMQTAKYLEEPSHQEFKTGVTEDQPDEETSQLPDWFQKLAKPPTLDRNWNKTLPDSHGPVQP
ncbi:hypothetical protein Tco_0953652 [Tanacetum coccineum]|uniref:Uncharacterized protein n=1 Tax=Tanacetum coccineum TaxID=301880 RepID=A0ABQ5E0H4_9ASTR